MLRRKDHGRKGDVKHGARAEGRVKMRKGGQGRAQETPADTPREAGARQATWGSALSAAGEGAERTQMGPEQAWP